MTSEGYWSTSSDTIVNFVRVNSFLIPNHSKQIDATFDATLSSRVGTAKTLP
jgi:hypothetical protein